MTEVKEKNTEKEHHYGLVFMALIFGFAGGMLGSTINLGNQGVKNITENRQEIVLQESEIISDVAEKIAPSVVSISVSSPSLNPFFRGDTESQGSGIILTEDGLIVTNKHVVDKNFTSLTVITSDGQEFSKVKLVGQDPFNDIAFLQIDDVKGLTVAELGDSSIVKVGQKVIAIGNALGEFSGTVTSGIISGLGRPITAGGGGGSTPETLTNLFQTDAAINPGNSGGPLLNLNGQVIGINTAVAGDAENIGFSIPINDVSPGIKSVKEHGELIKPYLGVRFIPINKSVANRFELSVERGAYLFSSGSQPAVIGNSPADKAGLKEGDIILKIGEKDVTSTQGLPTLVNQHQVDEVLELLVLRDDQEITLQITLERAPDSL